MFLIKIYLFTSIIATSFLAYSKPTPSWKQYPYHAKDSKIFFPRDEGAHKIMPGLEWWYIVFHAKGIETGTNYSILVSYFNNFFRFFTITNLDTQEHLSGTTLGVLKSQSSHLDLTYKTKFGKDFLRTKKNSQNQLVPFEYEIETHHEKMFLKASLSSIKAPMMVGGDGFVDIGSTGKSWYYSLTRLMATGTLSFNGITEPFKATAWMDHQWGPFLVSPIEFNKLFETYEWFCIQLNDGTDIMINNIYNRKYQLPMRDQRYGGVQYFDQKGVFQQTLKRQFVRMSYWKDPVSGNFMSMGWSLKVPEWELELELIPDFKEQMVHFPFNGDFWEGSIQVIGTFKGRPVSGRAFGELMHRFAVPQLRLKKFKRSYRHKEVIPVKWTVINPDQGNPLLYDVDLITSDRPVISILNGTDKLETHFSLNNFFPRQTAPEHFWLQISAYSLDKTINSTIKSEVLSIYPSRNSITQ